MTFEWDESKNQENKLKHGISFEQVVPLFEQPHELEYDSDHSSVEEERWIIRGKLMEIGSVMVVHTEEVEGLIRIISARKE